MRLDDTELGIVCRGLVVAEVSLLTGIDLTGRFSPSITGLTTDTFIERAKKHLTEANVPMKEIVFFKDILNARELMANHLRLSSLRTIGNKVEDNRDYRYYYDDKDNTVLVVESPTFTYKQNVYDILYGYSDELFNEPSKESFSKIIVITDTSLENLITGVVNKHLGAFTDDGYLIDNILIPYDGLQTDADFASYLLSILNDCLNGSDDLPWDVIEMVINILNDYMPEVRCEDLNTCKENLYRAMYSYEDEYYY